ncbi:vitamin B12 transport ATP-binding protein BacA [mine drainage metagenome]|uniref:Vitamin B12 transport ATP-binding protein BacA n=1 Tax=mine drainage metagenome TaxID=410659 RepID=A0A1J5R5F6_9ZZZZ
MVFLVYLYVVVATVFAIRIGRPLIILNFLNEQLSANFRYALIRLREYGESIAFYRGDAVERGKSGLGKTTLLRAIVDGQVVRPGDQASVPAAEALLAAGHAAHRLVLSRRGAARPPRSCVNAISAISWRA